MENYEIFERFIIMLSAELLIFFFSNMKRNLKLHPLVIIVSICTFFLCLVFTKINMSVGIGFGLFAIFSILRFRTEVFSIHTTMFLFVSITLSILNTLLPIAAIGNLILINLVIVISYLTLNYFDKQDFYVEKKSLELILDENEFTTLSEKEKEMYIREKTKFEAFTFQIKMMDVQNNKVIVKVFY